MANTAIEISTAKPKDKIQLLKIFSDYGALSEQRVECYLKHNSTVVAKDKDKVIGITQWHVKENPCDGLAEVEEVYVANGYRNKGIGKKLVLFALKNATNYFKKNKFKLRRVFVFTSSTNIPARKLYESCGFRFRAAVGDIFKDGANEVVYVKKVEMM